MRMIQWSYLRWLWQGWDSGSLPTDYKSIGDGIVYDEVWDETAELLISNEVNKSEEEKSGIGGRERTNSEVGESEVERSEVGGEVESCEMEDSEVCSIK